MYKKILFVTWVSIFAMNVEAGGAAASRIKAKFETQAREAAAEVEAAVVAGDVTRAERASASISELNAKYGGAINVGAELARAQAAVAAARAAMVAAATPVVDFVVSEPSLPSLSSISADLSGLTASLRARLAAAGGASGGGAGCSGGGTSAGAGATDGLSAATVALKTAQREGLELGAKLVGWARDKAATEGSVLEVDMMHQLELAALQAGARDWDSLKEVLDKYTVFGALTNIRTILGLPSIPVEEETAGLPRAACAAAAAAAVDTTDPVNDDPSEAPSAPVGAAGRAIPDLDVAGRPGE